MIYYTFIVKLSQKFEKVFLKYMRLFYATWYKVKEPEELRDKTIEGETTALEFCFACPVYGRVYSLLNCFAALTHAKMFLYDHKNDVYADKPTIVAEIKAGRRLKAFMWFAKEVFLYKVSHMKQTIKQTITKEKAKRLQKKSLRKARVALARNTDKVVVPAFLANVDDEELPF